MCLHFLILNAMLGVALRRSVVGAKVGVSWRCLMGTVLPFTSGTFKLDDEQMRKASEWLKIHSATCFYFGPQTAGWFGTPLAYVFRPHGCGEGVEVICNCGEKLDISTID